MKRILFDVPRWHVFLHRDARGLDRAEVADSPLMRFEDELFERLYSGDCDRLPEREQEPSMRAWAEQVHSAAERLPAFARLAGECRGDPLAAAAATETLMAELKPQGPSDPKPDSKTRRTLARACQKASDTVEGLRDTLEGLDQVAFGPVSGSGSATGGELEPSSVRALASRLRQDERLKRIALLAGRFKRIAATKRRQKIRHGADEVNDVCQGDDVARLLPSEVVRLLRPRLRLVVLRALTERECLQYELAGTETLGKGPIVAALDKSGSMSGDRDVWATAVALALLDQARCERRPFVLLGFDGRVKFEATVTPGQPLPEAGLFVACAGGTDIGGAVEHGLRRIRESSGQLRHSDIVLITDGESEVGRAQILRDEAKAMDVTVLGFGIGVSTDSLAPWCDEVHAVSTLDRIDDASAEAMFGR